MDFNDILRLVSGGGPTSTIMDAQASAPQQQMPQAPEPNAPQGIKTPVTNPQPATAAPQAYQSPSDLANMYVQLMKDNRNAAQLDSGLNLIAAGLSNSPTNRAALIQGATASGHGGMTLTANDMINFQKQADAQRQQLIMQQALPALQKQYKMSDAQIKALQASGQLGDVLKHFTTENLTQVKDENGQVHMVAPRSGTIVATLGSEKEDPTQWVEGPNGPELRNSRTGQLVEKGVGTKPPDLKFENTPEGLTAVHPKTGEVIAKAIGGAPTPETDKFVRPDGSQFLRDKRNGTVTEVAPAAKPGDVVPASEQELFAINRAREARGEKALTAEELIKLKQQPGTTVNVGPQGQPFQAPEKGYDYVRNADNTVKVNEKGQPELYKIPGGSPAEEAAAATKKEGETAKKEAAQQRLKMASVSAVVRSAQDAEKIIDEAPFYAPAAGFGASVGGYFGGSPTINLRSKLGEINANTAFAQLKAMRESSTSGASGLGQVTDFEQRMLSSATANLDQYQDPGQLKRALRKAQAAMMVMAENKFDEKDAGDYDKALNAKMQELEKASKPVKGKYGGDIRLRE